MSEALNLSPSLRQLQLRYGGHIQGKELRMPCPVHGGEDNNLVVSVKDGKFLVFCHSHRCPGETVLKQFREDGMFADVANPENEEVARFEEWISHQQGYRLEATYRHPSGKTLRAWRHDNPPNFPNSDRRMPKVMAKGSRDGYWPLLWPEDGPDPVVVCEGEKSAQAVQAAGFTGCSYVGGSACAGKAAWEPLQKRKVLIWPDKDEPGIKAAQVVRQHLPHAVILKPVASPKGGDAADLPLEARKEFLEKAVPLEDQGKVEGPSLPIIEDDSTGLARLLELLAVELRFNERLRKSQWSSKGAARWHDLDDLTESRWRDICRRSFRFDRRGQVMPAKWSLLSWEDALNAHLHTRRVDPFLDYLYHLEGKWDGEERLENWLHWTLGAAAEDEAARFSGKAIFVGAVHRTYEPGAVHDWIPILVGHQALGKGRVLQALVPKLEYFNNRLPIGADDKVTIERAQEAVLVEFAELAGMTRRDSDMLKNFMSTRYDVARGAWERRTSRVPRRWIGIGTANRMANGILPVDETGQRRYLIVECEGNADFGNLDAVETWCAENRDQLWAEAVELARVAGENIYEEHLIPEWLRQQQERDVQRYAQQNDQASDIADACVAEGKSGLTIVEILKQHLRSVEDSEVSAMDVAKMRGMQMDVARELQMRGWRKRRSQRGQVRAIRWYGPESEGD